MNDVREIEDKLNAASFDFDAGELEALKNKLRCLRRSVAATLSVLKERRVLNDEEIEQIIRGY